ncbi:DegT/DnrJ/EryC1/StrS aminotransferase family protein [Paenibacillus sp. V4I5]|uniref:DegT/DnrJ/EryC1/StrS family aminotransferase n=1 Tax=Paenibacillus sp. V4I5 TaxID=3042306 RepID=UPI002794B4D0|nr:DegT/DnrJ/EryC1/StrS family aminotransferase [Paenibacillus sp. V4I5]MDQ0920232.1 dTDP-4-amino-4,6-dideoxygalactose transaminase [Paenibacillus sp. V4I5]
MEKLAIDGGKPIRSTPLPPPFRGSMLIGEEEINSVSKVLAAKSPFRYYGPDMQYAVKALEDMIARDLNIPYVLGVSSCTAGLVVAMKALGIGYGDKVIVPANTFIATAGAVVSSNAVPVYVDMDETLNLDADDLERVYDDEVKAIIVVHINGSPCDMDKIMAFAKKRNIYVIEDVAQSQGCTYKGKICGTIGDIGVFSFQMNKMLTAGEGGAVITSNPELFERAVRYHDQGMFRDKDRFQIEPQYVMSGQNYRMSELTGAVMIEQWKKLDTVIGTMRRHHRKIRSYILAEMPKVRFRAAVDDDGDTGCVLGIVHSTLERAQEYAAAMKAENVSTHAMYDGIPCYMIPCFFEQRTAEKDNFPYNYPFKNPVVYTKDMCPKCDDLLGRITITLISPILTDEEADEIATAAVKVLKALEAKESAKAHG